MQLIAFLILLEIIVGGLTALPSKKSQQARSYDKTSRDVMGESTDDTSQEQSSQSQDETQASPTAENQSTTPQQNPQDNPTSTPQDPATSQSTNQTSHEEVTPVQSTNTSSQETPQSPSQPESKSGENNQVQIESAPTGEINITPSQTGEGSESINTDNNTQDAIQIDVNKSLETADSKIFSNVSQNNSAEQLSNDTVGELNHEEEQLKNTTDPQDQVQLLTQFASNNIQNLHENLTTDNLDDMAFNAQRLTYQIDKSIDIIQSLNQQDTAKFKDKIDTICKNAEYVLRPSQLAVTEDVEEALEVSRGKCFNLEK